jgi:hypothetical protein
LLFSPNWLYIATVCLILPRYLRLVVLRGRDMNTESSEYNEAVFLIRLRRCVPLNKTNELVFFVHLHGYLLFTFQNCENLKHNRRDFSKNL